MQYINDLNKGLYEIIHDNCILPYLIKFAFFLYFTYLFIY